MQFCRSPARPATEFSPADFGLDFPVLRKSVHARRRRLVPLAVSPRIVSALLDGTAPADLTVRRSRAGCCGNEEEPQWARAAPLTVITGDRKTRERRAGRRRALDQNEQITCWRCENDTGIATSMAVFGTAPHAAPAQAGTILACVSVRARRPDDARCPQHARHNCLPLRRRLGNLLRDPSWLLGSGLCRSRCWLGYHDWIGNRLRNIDGFRAGLMSTNHAGSP